MKSTWISFVFIFGIFLSTTLKGQENGSVGIGIEDPNPNAILHLVSPGNNQGLLIPTMTTDQRTSALFTGKLTSVDNGLLVFDLTEKTFYYWQDTGWQALTAGNQSLQFDPVNHVLQLSGGNAIDLSELATTDWNDLRNTPTDFLDGTDEVDDADADPTNEIQDLTISGTLLSITNKENANVIDLSTLAGLGNQDLIFSNGALSLSGDPDATTIDFTGYDTDVTDDFDGLFSSLTGVPTDLADGDQVDDADADPTNEIQDLDLTGDNLTITGNSLPTSIDLSQYKDNTDVLAGLSPSEGQVAKYLSGSWQVDDDDVNDADADPLNEIQTLSTEGNRVSLSGNGGSIILNDADSTNEIQSLLLSGEMLSLSSDPSGTVLDFTGWDKNASDDFDGQFLSLTGVPDDLLDGDQTEDADADSLNEIQTLSMEGNMVTLSNDGGSILLNDTDSLNEIQLITTDNSPGNITLSKDKTLVLNVDDADASASNEIQTLSVNNTIPGNLSLSDGGTVTLNVDDADASSTNELITTTSLRPGNMLRIEESGINHDVDLSSLIDDADADNSNEVITETVLSGTQLNITEAGVLRSVDLSSLVNDADADVRNEIQDLTFNSLNNQLRLTHPDGDQVWDLSELDNATPWIEENNSTNINYLGNYATANNLIAKPNPKHVNEADLINSVGRLTSSMINYHKLVPIHLSGSTTLRNIDKGINGQEIIIMIIGPGTLNVDGEFGNLFLSSVSHALTQGSTLHMTYFIDQSSGTSFDGWMEVSVSISAR